MKKLILLATLIISIFSYLFIRNYILPLNSGTGAPPYLIGDEGNPGFDRFSWLQDWERPESPPKVVLQVGHWKNSDLPDELARLRGNTGATGGGKSEWEVNYGIAQATKEILEKEGILVDIIPATVPAQYWSDVFVAIHADGSIDLSKSGYKVASPRRDYTGNSQVLGESIEKNYQKSTNLIIDPNVTRNMRGYYAFAWWRYEHAVHPMSASVILETGFLSNSKDRRILIGTPEKSAQGLASGIIEYLASQNLLVNN